MSHYQTIFPSLEEFSLMKYFVSTSRGVSFPVDVDVGAPLHAATKSSSLLSVGVKIDYQGKPESVDLTKRKGIEVGLILKVMVGCPVLLPLKVDLEL